MFPPIPTWDSLHPIIIHFPIALLIIAPLFIILGLFFRDNSKWFHISALTLMVIGTLSVFLAVSTGEAAGELAIRTPQIEAVLEQHEEMAETTKIVFGILTGIYGLLIITPLVMRKTIPQKVAIPAQSAFLLLFSGCLLLLINTAHQGGRLVHEFGVHAMMPTDSTPTLSPTYSDED